MKNIEHKCHVFYGNEIQEGKALDIIARFEKEGWVMCACHPFEGEEYGVIYKCYYYYFKRYSN